MNDQEPVRKALFAALEKEPRIDLRRDRIDIVLDRGGVATLSGEVEDLGAKRVACERAAALPGVNGVVDRLRVRPASPMPDDAIATHLEQILVGDSDFDTCEIRRRTGSEVVTVRGPVADGQGWWIELSVDDGVVTLAGEVPSLSHKRLAGVLAWWVPGTCDVLNRLGVRPDEQDTDDEILDALRIALEKDWLVDATQVNAACRDGVITLEGLVGSEAERNAAEFDAWALFAVDGVVNRLGVGELGRASG